MPRPKHIYSGPMEGLKGAVMDYTTGVENQRMQNRYGQGPQLGPGLSPDDPLGVALQGRAREERINAQMAGQTPMFGPLPNPQWEGYFQALQERGVNKLRGGPSAPGSNQVTGLSSQPNYFSAGNQALDGLRQTHNRRKL